MDEKFSAIKINKKNFNRNYDPEILAVDGFSYQSFSGAKFPHEKIARKLKNSNPYTVTVIIDNLNPLFWNNKKFVKKTKTIIWSRYKELLYEYFGKEFGNQEGNELYAKWLEKYRPAWEKDERRKEIDYYIIENELEIRYRGKILKRFKNHEKLFKERMRIDRKRYYNLPEPLNRVDWRNPYDNIFIWEENGKKVVRKGGSGSSGGRQINSEFIFAFSLINKENPIKSYLFWYGDDNELYFIKEFSSLTIPVYDIGSNYFLGRDEEKRILSGVNTLSWFSNDIFGTPKEIVIKQEGKGNS